MKNIKLVILTVLFLGVGLLLVGNFQSKPARAEVIDLHMTPTCGCCAVYESFLKREGFEVNNHTHNDLREIHKELPVPNELRSCHLMELDGYIAEGHLPLKAIDHLLEEKPDISGITLPGMPSGTPGMPGPKKETWQIYEIVDGLQTGVYLEI